MGRESASENGKACRVMGREGQEQAQVKIRKQVESWGERGESKHK